MRSHSEEETATTLVFITFGCNRLLFSQTGGQPNLTKINKPNVEYFLAGVDSRTKVQAP